MSQLHYRPWVRFEYTGSWIEDTKCDITRVLYPRGYFKYSEVSRVYHDIYEAIYEGRRKCNTSKRAFKYHDTWSGMFSAFNNLTHRQEFKRVFTYILRDLADGIIPRNLGIYVYAAEDSFMPLVHDFINLARLSNGLLNNICFVVERVDPSTINALIRRQNRSDEKNWRGGRSIVGQQPSSQARSPQTMTWRLKGSKNTEGTANSKNTEETTNGRSVAKQPAIIPIYRIRAVRTSTLDRNSAV